MIKNYIKLMISSLLLVGILFQVAGAAETSPLPMRIMPLGDSITYDNRESDLNDPRPISRRTAYRSHLWYMFQDANITVDFVGSRAAGQSVTPPFDPDNEGHPGWHSLDIAENAYSYMANSTPDTVLLHIGTNDHGTSVYGMTRILQEIDLYEQESGNSVRVLVALIIDRKDGDSIIRKFNDNVKELVTSRLLAGDNIGLVDMYNGAGLSSGNYADNTHPNDSGYLKMARVWYNALLTPYNLELNKFPGTLVSASYVESINVNVASDSVEFITEVPESGITF